MGLNQHIRMKHNIDQVDGLAYSVLETLNMSDNKENKSLTVNVKLKEAKLKIEPCMLLWPPKKCQRLIRFCERVIKGENRSQS